MNAVATLLATVNIAGLNRSTLVAQLRADSPEVSDWDWRAVCYLFAS
jgi:hypothetical protein